MQSRALIRANVAAVYNMALECHRWLATGFEIAAISAGEDTWPFGEYEAKFGSNRHIRGPDYM
jgi:hypothetical protein